MCRGDVTEDEGNEGADQLKRKSLFIAVKPFAVNLNIMSAEWTGKNTKAFSLSFC